MTISRVTGVENATLKRFEGLEISQGEHTPFIVFDATVEDVERAIESAPFFGAIALNLMNAGFRVVSAKRLS
jgi:hypothetical protein